MESLKKVLGGVVAVAIAIIAATVGRQVVKSLASSGGHVTNDNEIVSQLQQASNELNKTLPTIYDRATRLDSTVAGPGKTWTYMYTILSPNSSSLTQQDIDKTLGASIRNGVCTAKFMKVFVNNGVQVEYIYRDSHGKVIGSIVVNPSDCTPNS